MERHGRLFLAGARRAARSDGLTTASARKGASRRAWALGGSLICLLGAALCLDALRSLPYSTSTFVAASDAQIDAAPDPRGFVIGSVRWDVAAFSREPNLASLRAYFAEACPGLSGLDAGVCISGALHYAFPVGTPKREMFDRDYQPTADLEAHRAGEPGHCVTRSALAAATLLASGIPARVVQLLPLMKAGHTVFEVWDARYGWVLLDPSLRGYLEVDGGPASALRASSASAKVRWHPLGGSLGADAGVSAYHEQAPSTFVGRQMYPEPWLYTRAGQHHALWPLRGTFVYRGRWSWELGWGQLVTRWGTMVLLAAAFGLGLFATRRRASTGRPDHEPA